MPENSVLYIDFEPNVIFANVRSIISNQTKINDTLINQGRFFSDSDFIDDDARIAVIGRSVPVYTVGDTDYFVWMGNEYEVIGHIGFDFPTRLDYEVILALHDEHLDHPVRRYILDSPNLQANFDFIGNEESLGYVFVLGSANLSVLNVINQGNSQIFVAISFLAFLGFNILSAIKYISNRMTQELKIKKIFGYNNSLLSHTASKEIGCVLLLSSLGAFAILILTNSYSGLLLAVNLLLLLFLYVYMRVTFFRKLIGMANLRLGDIC